MSVEMLTKDDFAERLKITLRKRGLKQSDISKATGVDVSKISNYFRGVNFPPVDVLAEIARALDVSIDYLCYGETTSNSPKTLGDAARTIVSLYGNGYISISSSARIERIRLGNDPFEFEDLEQQTAEITFPFRVIGSENNLDKFVLDLITMEELVDAKTISWDFFKRWLDDRYRTLDEEYVDFTSILLLNEDGTVDSQE